MLQPRTMDKLGMQKEIIGRCMTILYLPFIRNMHTVEIAYVMENKLELDQVRVPGMAMGKVSVSAVPLPITLNT